MTPETRLVMVLSFYSYWGISYAKLVADDRQESKGRKENVRLLYFWWAEICA